MGAINQIQMSYVPLEDRILFRMNTVDSDGFEFWLTRRYVKLLWQALINQMVQDEQISNQTSDFAKKEMLAFQQQEVEQSMDYSKTFEEETLQKPLGSAPILLSKISVKRNEDDAPVLSLHPEEGEGVDLALNQTLLHSISKLLQDTVAKAEWEMNLGQSLSTEPSTASIAPRSIN